MFPHTGPRRVRVYDTFSERRPPLQVAVYLLDLPLEANSDHWEYETGMLLVFAPDNLAASRNLTLMTALKQSFPALTCLKDLHPSANNSVVFENTFVPIHRVVADRSSGGRTPSCQLLVQFSENEYENSAWTLEKSVPQR